MSRLLPNNWRAIRAFYREAGPAIVEAGANEWGIDPYEWDGHGIINLTPIERWLWDDIRACNAVFYPQFPVLNYFVDFGNPVAKVALECDGADYHDPVKDSIRDRMLVHAGWAVYRFPGWMCRQDSDEETGTPSEASLRMREICDRHQVSRFSRTKRDVEKSQRGLTEHALMMESFARGSAIRQAVEAAK